MVYSMPPYLNSPRNFWSFVKSRRQYNVGDYLLQQDLTTVYGGQFRQSEHTE